MIIFWTDTRSDPVLQGLKPYDITINCLNPIITRAFRDCESLDRVGWSPTASSFYGLKQLNIDQVNKKLEKSIFGCMIKPYFNS